MNKHLNYFSTIKFLSKYIFKYKKNYLMFSLGWFFDIVLKIYTPIMFAIMIDEIVYYQHVDVYLRIGIAFVVMLVLSCIVHFFTQAQYAYLEIMYTFDIKNDVYDKLQYAQSSFLSDMKTGDVMNTIQKHSSECMVFVIRNIIHTVNNTLALILYIIYIFVIGWQFGLLMLITVPLSTYLTTKFGKKIRELNDQYNNEYGNYSGWLMETLNSVSEIRMQSSQKRASKFFVNFHKKLFSINNNNSVKSLTAKNVIKLVNLLMQLMIYGICAYLAYKSKMTIGVLTVILAYFAGVTQKVTFFSDYFIEAQKRIACIQRVYDFIQIPSEKNWSGKDELNIVNGTIKFKDICFNYQNKKNLFNDFNLDIEGGHKIALVGKSGSGKTTLAYMLVGFFQPNHGSIEIDGKKINDCSLQTIRQNIGIVQQEVLIFDGTIRSNLALGKKEATDEEMILACEKAGLAEYINSLEQGLDTIIGSEGIGLSGGQKQRIAIARIYLKNPKIIIFDEATSALDKETESYIHESWNKLLAGRTSIVIAHRISSVMLCDKTVLIENGKLLEYGDTKDLLENSIAMKELFAIS